MADGHARPGPGPPAGRHLGAPPAPPRHPAAARDGVYQLFFQFTGIAEATIEADDWAWLQMFSRGDGDTGQWIEDLSRPGALTAALNWARANLASRVPGP